MNAWQPDEFADNPADFVISDNPQSLLCVCGHDKGKHIRRMDDCQVPTCCCPLWVLQDDKGVKMVDDVMLWCFQYFFHMDKANACMHNAPVKFSPITFRLMGSLMETWNPDEDITQEMAEVRSHVNQYELDPGR